jgi:hypothetical protein
MEMHLSVETMCSTSARKSEEFNGGWNETFEWQIFLFLFSRGRHELFSYKNGPFRSDVSKYLCNNNEICELLPSKYMCLQIYCVIYVCWDNLCLEITNFW